MFWTNHLNCWEALSHAGVQMNPLFKLSNRRRGEVVSASFGKNLCKLYCEPVNDFSCFLDWGGFKSWTVWAFRTDGLIPSFPIRKPSHSHSVFSNCFFRKFKAAFESASCLRIFSTNAMSFVLVHFDTTKMSSWMRSLEEIPWVSYLYLLEFRWNWNEYVKSVLKTICPRRFSPY